MSEKVSFVIDIEGNAYKGILQLDGAVKNIVKSVNAASDSFDSLVKEVFNFSNIANVFEKVTQSFHAVSGGALEFEQQQRNLQTLLGGSAEKAQELTDRLRGFAKNTTYDSSTLIEAQKTMMSFGIESGKAFDTLRHIGDIAMGDKQRMQSLALAFSQATSTGKLMGQDLLQMINAGFNPLQVISQKTGRSMADLKEEMGKGKISADMLAQAFQWATEEGALFYRGAESAADTTAGKIAQLHGKIEELQLKLFEATGGATAFIGELGDIATPLSAVASLAPVFSGMFSTISKGSKAAVKICTSGWAKFMKNMRAMVLASGLYFNVVTYGAHGASGALRVMGQIGADACKAIGRGIMSIPVLGWIAAGVTAAIALFSMLWERSEKFRMGVFVLWEALKSLFGWLYENIAKPVGNLFVSIWNGVKGMFDSFFDWLGDKFDWVGKVLRKILPKGVFERGVAAGKASWANGHKAELGINDDLQKALSGGTSGTSSGGGTETGRSTEAIATGGSRRTDIRISIKSLVENMVFNGTAAENRDEMQRSIAQALLQVLNMAQASV